MNRENIARIIGISVAFVIVAAAWVVQPSMPWNLLYVIPISIIGTLLIMSVFQKLQDERFTHNMNLAARNSFVFLLFALPSAGALIATEVIVLDTLGVILLLWVVSLAIWYLSGVYYYMR